MKQLLILLVLGNLVAGCATVPPAPPLTQADVISMLQAGATEEDVMRRIEATGTVFYLSADDVVFLRQQGVGDRVVTFMMNTVTRAAVAEQHRRDLYYHQHFYWGPLWGPRCR